LERIGNAEARKLLQDLSDGAPEASLSLQAKAVLDRLGKAEDTAAPGAGALWDALAREDSMAAYRAIRMLAQQPATAAQLRDGIKQIAAKDTFSDDPARVAKLMAELDSEEFAVRDRASKSLRDLGPLAVPALRKALDAKPKPSLEMRQRLEELVDAATKPTSSPEMLRVSRALEALELMGTPEGREALQALSKELQVPWLRTAAAEALRRQGGM